MKPYPLLRQVPMFTDLDDDALQLLADRATIKIYEAKGRIVNQADDTQAFFIVLSGRVKIFRSNPEGKEQILYLVEEGQPFCFCTAFANRPYPVNVSALEESWVASIPASDMEDLATKEPLLMLKMVQTLSSRLLEAMNMVESLSLQGVQQRISCFLLHAESCSRQPPGSTFSLPVSHRDMAKIVGTTPETLSRMIQNLKREKIIEASGKNIRIIDRDRLF